MAANAAIWSAVPSARPPAPAEAEDCRVAGWLSKLRRASGIQASSADSGIAAKRRPSTRAPPTAGADCLSDAGRQARESSPVRRTTMQWRTGFPVASPAAPHSPVTFAQHGRRKLPFTTPSSEAASQCTPASDGDLTAGHGKQRQPCCIWITKTPTGSGARPRQKEGQGHRPQPRRSGSSRPPARTPGAPEARRAPRLPPPRLAAKADNDRADQIHALVLGFEHRAGGN